MADVCDTKRTTGSPWGATPGRLAGSVVFRAAARSGVVSGTSPACQSAAVWPGFSRDHALTKVTAVLTYGSASGTCAAATVGDADGSRGWAPARPAPLLN